MNKGKKGNDFTFPAKKIFYGPESSESGRSSGTYGIYRYNTVWYHPFCSVPFFVALSMHLRVCIRCAQKREWRDTKIDV